MLKVDTTGQCWLWKGSDNGRGYGRFSVDGKTYQQAARWLLGHLRGKPLESHEWACHHCDNPRCVRADHLYVGDSESNARDMAERGRAKNGNSAKTHCPKGHPYDEENTYRWGNHRACRTCQRVT